MKPKRRLILLLLFLSIPSYALSEESARDYIVLYRIQTAEGNNFAAMEAYTRAIDLDPQNSAAYHSRAEVKERIKDYSGALDD